MSSIDARDGLAAARLWAGESPASGLLAAPGQPRPAQLDLDEVLRQLLPTSGADAAEIFLAAPGSNQLVLVAHQGRAPHAFRQITSFEPGQGFPGLIAASGEPIISADLPRDDRYLRTAVKDSGFHSYLGVPIWSESGLVGSLHIASLRGGEGLMAALPLLTSVAQVLGWSLETARRRAAEPIVGHLLDPSAGASGNLWGIANLVVRTLVETTGADGGLLLLLDAESGTLEIAAEHQLPPRLRQVVAQPCDPSDCLALQQHRCIVSRSGQPVASARCRAVRRDFNMSLCLPVEVGGRTLGVAVVGRDRPDSLPARRLTLVHTVVDQAAVLLHNAQVGLGQESAARRSVPSERIVHSLARTGREQGPGVRAEDRADSRPDEMPELRFRCLGPFTIVRDGRLVPEAVFGRRQPLTILKILLTRYGRPVHREQLLEYLWPDQDPAVTMARLNVAIHRLRRGLEPNASRGKSSHFIRRQGDCYLFDTDSRHHLDSQEFLQAAGLSAQLEAAGERAAARAACVKAVGLYAGDFLEDEPYSHWCAVERQQFREQLIVVLRRLARLQLAEGHAEAAVSCYRRALELNETLEDLHRGLMEALWTAGLRDQALRQYEECRALLRREFGVTPSGETEFVYRRIAVESARSSQGSTN